MPTHEVRSLGEVRHIIRDANVREEQEFILREDTPLQEAKSLWRVATAGGGYGVLSNAEVLAGKYDAFIFVKQKLDGLRSLLKNSDPKLDELVDFTDHLDAVLAAGGPGLPLSYEPKAVQGGPSLYLDTDEPIAEEDLDQHIDLLRSLLLNISSPGSPAPSGYRSAEALKAREELEQKALAELNSEYLKIKRDVLADMRTGLEKGIRKLERKFLYEPTHLGCGSGDYDRFKDLPMLPGERRGYTW